MEAEMDTELSKQRHSLRSQLQKIADLKDGWHNGTEGRAITKNEYERAKQFISLPDDVIAGFVMSPPVESGISLWAHRNDQVCDIDITDTTIAGYTFSIEEDNYTSVEEELPNMEAVEAFVRKSFNREVGWVSAHPDYSDHEIADQA